MVESISVIAVGIPELITIIGAMGLVIYGLMKMFLKKEMKRISDLEADVSELKTNSIGRTEFSQTINIMRDEIRQGNNATHQGLLEVHRRLDKLLLKITKVDEG